MLLLPAARKDRRAIREIRVTRTARSALEGWNLTGGGATRAPHASSSARPLSYVRPRGRADDKRMPRTRRSLPLVAIAVALAAWPASAGAVPTVTEFTSGLSLDPGPTDIVAGSDGTLWFTEQNGNGGIGRVTLDGQVTEYLAGLTPGLSLLREPTGIAAGPDGRIWFTEQAAPGAIAALDPGAASSRSARPARGAA